jgi:SAM-dependent methyltransferase
MALDSRQLEEFYDGRMGIVARRLIGQSLRRSWHNLGGRRLLGYGYAVPYLRLFAEAERAIAAMPESQGAVPWGLGGRVQTALVEELALPFPDAMFDCVLVIHGLELAESQRPLLRELWRVMTSEARLIVVAPNRASLWAQLEKSPFGHGQPYTKTQLGRLLGDALFQPERWDSALFLPPFGRRRAVRTGHFWERVGHRLWPQLAGVHIVEATKSLYMPMPIKGLRRRVLRPAIAGAIGVPVRE